MMNWIDIETTGLDPDKDYLLEVGLIITDDKLNEVVRGACIVETWSVETLMESSNQFVRDMHMDSGLWGAMGEGGGISKPRIEERLVSLIEKYGGDEKHPLCGNSVHFDRAWLKVHMPKLEAAVHYRNFDVSTIKELHKRFGPAPCLPFECHKEHRVLGDLDNSIAELRYYLALIGWAP